MDDVTAAHTKIGIGAALAAATGLTLNEWVAVVTIAYFLLQIGLLIPKYCDRFHAWRSRHRK